MALSLRGVIKKMALKSRERLNNYLKKNKQFENKTLNKIRIDSSSFILPSSPMAVGASLMKTPFLRQQIKNIISKKGGDKTRLIPIANVAKRYVQKVGEKVYSSRGKLQEIYQKHKGQITKSEFLRLSDVISNPHKAKIDPRPKNRGSVIFIKKIGKSLFAAIQIREKVGRASVLKTIFGSSKNKKIQKFLDFPDLPTGGRASSP